MTEKITEWQTDHDGMRRTDAFYFVAEAGESPAKVIVYRSGEAPGAEAVAELDARNWTPAGYNAAWMRDCLSRKNYDRLMPNMKAAYDFLNARLGS